MDKQESMVNWKVSVAACEAAMVGTFCYRGLEGDKGYLVQCFILRTNTHLQCRDMASKHRRANANVTRRMFIAQVYLLLSITNALLASN